MELFCCGSESSSPAKGEQVNQLQGLVISVFLDGSKDQLNIRRRWTPLMVEQGTEENHWTILTGLADAL
jgi:hypothetical protein